MARSVIDELNQTYEHKKSLTAGAEATLLRYSWPGNVRELRNVMERAFIMSDGEQIQAEDLAILDNGDPAAAEEEVSAGGADRGGGLSAVSLLHHPHIPSFSVVLSLKHCFNCEAAVPLLPPGFFPLHPKTAQFDCLFLSR